MKPILPLLACLLAPVLLVPGANAQGPSGNSAAAIHDEPDTQVLAYLRIPFGKPAQQPDPPRIGFGLFADCSGLSNRLSTQHQSACGSQPVRSLEISRELYDRDWLISFSGTNRWVGIARLLPDGFASVREYGPILSGPGIAESMED